MHFKNREIKKMPLFKRDFLIAFGLLFLILSTCFGHALWFDRHRLVGRIDFETAKQAERPFDVYVIPDRTAYAPEEKKLTWTPWWLGNSDIYGRVFETDQKEAHLDIHVYQPCHIRVRLVGSHCESWKLRRLNPKVSFSSFKINKQEILTQAQTVWHDQAFIYEFDAIPGMIQIDAVWDRPSD